MSMEDTSYCGTLCDRRDCERNLAFYAPANEIYTCTTFDDDNQDLHHESCIWRREVKVDDFHKKSN